MKSLDFNRYVLGLCVAGALVVGCGGSQPPLSWKGVSVAPSAKYYCTGTNGLPQRRAPSC
jgi:hypothetical protein